MTLPTMMSVTQLESKLAQENLVILDSRFYLTDIDKGAQVYQQGHVPGALFIDLHHQLAGPETTFTGRHPLPDPEAFAQTLATLGIHARSEVVIYDDMGGAMAARAWWMLAQQGINVAVLDGGFPAWQAAGFAIQDGQNSASPAPSKMAVSFPWLITEDAVANHFESGEFQLVDARSEDRFNGENETMDPVAGHIPGALNRPFSDNLTPHGHMKTPAQLLEEWRRLLHAVEPPVVYYCGSGVTACHNVLAMNYAGLEAKYIYVGSWSQWAKRILRQIDNS